MRRLRHDINYLTSAALLVAALAAILTGIVAQLWDLNDFWYHTYAGYVMAVLSLIHVWLNWGRLISYARFRVFQRASQQRSEQKAPVFVQQPEAIAATTSTNAGFVQTMQRLVVSRRGFLTLALGGIGGFFAGRGFKQPPPIAQGSDLGVVYHQWSKPGVIDVLGSVANWGAQPPLYKTYPQAPRIPLPKPQLAAGLPTEQAIIQRRSSRTYSGVAMSITQLSQILLLMGGLSGDRWGNNLRTAPSSGALFPIEVYPVIHNVSGIASGIYHYNVKDHQLHQLRAGDFRAEVVQQGLNQQFLGQANVVFFLTVIFQRMRFKYQDRTYRYGLIEAGHLGQNLYLAATSMGLGACAIGAFMDDAINAMLGVDGTEEAAIYMLTVGNI